MTIRIKEQTGLKKVDKGLLSLRLEKMSLESPVLAVGHIFHLLGLQGLTATYFERDLERTRELSVQYQENLFVLSLLMINSAESLENVLTQIVIQASTAEEINAFQRHLDDYYVRRA